MKKRLRVKDFGIPEAIPGETADFIQEEKIELAELEKEFAGIMRDYKSLIYSYLEDPDTEPELLEFITTDDCINRILKDDSKYKQLCGKIKIRTYYVEFDREKGTIGYE